VETINRELRTSLTSVEKRLTDLIHKNLITRLDENGSVIYSYAPGSTVVAIIDQIAGLYATHRVAIIDAIFSKPSGGIKDFSDAFKIKGKDK
jgi:predicted transcriptional regulator